MTTTSRRWLAVLAVSIPLASALAVAQAPAPQGPAAPAAPVAPPEPVHRMPDGKPDLQGVYNPQAAGANFGLEEHAALYGVPGGKGVIVDPPDRKLPMLDWARAEAENRKRPERGYDDPAAHCFQNGLPRTMYTGGFQILQPPGYVVMLFAGDTGAAYRIVSLDGRPHAPEAMRSWQGDSVGRWEGDTLVVETTNLNGRAWMNQAGEIVSYAETVVERFTPVDGTTINYQATITDPVVYSKPWTIAYPLKKGQDELLEVACHEGDRDLEHLKKVRDSAK